MPESISYEQYLNEHGELTYKNKGGSMRPLLRAGRDLFTVKKKGTERCRAGDVVLFRHAGNVVLHRVVELKEGGYVCLGDNAILPERGVTDADILGVMTGFIRKGKAHTVDEPLYRLYSGCMVRFRRPRALLKKVYLRVRDTLLPTIAGRRESFPVPSGEPAAPPTPARKADLQAAADDMLYLIRCALNMDKPDAERVAGMDLTAVYAAADRHMMTSMVATGLELAGVKNEPFIQAQAKAIRKNAALEADFAILSKKLQEAGIWHMPLKGALIKDLYPRFGMRQMSDYDVLFDPERREDVHKIMESMGYKDSEDRGEEHHFQLIKPPMYVFEMHWQLFDYKPNVPLLQYYRDFFPHLVPVAAAPYRYAFTPEDFYLFLLAHDFKHYEGAGSGLRIVADIWIYLRKVGYPKDHAYVEHELEELGMTEFERDVRELGEALFGSGEMTSGAEASLKARIAAGTYGSEANRVNRDVEALGGGSKGKLRYVLKRLFIPRRIIGERYPLFLNVPLLLPFLPLWRLIHGASLHWPRVRAELRAVFRRR